MGRLLGGLKDFSGTDLGGVAIKGALEKAGVAPDQVDYVIMGQVLQAGAGQIPARQAAVKAGIPMTVPALTDQQGLPVGHRRHRAGRPADPGRRVRRRRRRRHGVDDPGAAPAAEVARGLKYGDVTLVDSMAYDGLWDVFTDQAMGALTETRNAELGIYPRGAGRVRGAARTSWPPRPGRTACSTTRSSPVEIPQRKGDPIVVTRRRGHPRRHHRRERSARLRPAFSKDGTITAGSASQISDGACRGRRDEQGQGRGARARPGWPRSAPTAWSPARTRRCSSQPANAIARRARGRASRRPTSTSSRSTRRSPRSASRRRASSASTEDSVNVNGGAIALGHPSA